MKTTMEIEHESRRCPICATRHAEPQRIVADVVHCPRCGVPCFFPAGYFPNDPALVLMARCVNCEVSFDANEGGGVVVIHPTRFESDAIKIPTPRGIMRNVELVR